MEDNFFICPHCGAEVSQNAKACPNCGSDENTGWSESTYMDEVGIFDDSDYEEVLLNEFGSNNKKQAKKVSFKSIIGAIIALIFLFMLIKNLFVYS